MCGRDKVLGLILIVFGLGAIFAYILPLAVLVVIECIFIVCIGYTLFRR